MDKQRIISYKSSFDAIAHHINNEDNSEQVEIWFARELQKLLGYARWENFQVAIGRAVDSCIAQNINIDDHFREVTKMVELGSRGIKAEPLPPAEDIKKLERLTANEEKKIEKTSHKLPKRFRKQ